MDRIEELVKDIFTTDKGQKLLSAWFRRDVGCKKNYDSPTVLAAQAARSDFVIEILAQAEIDLVQLGVYKPSESAQEDLPIKDDFFS